MSTMTDTLDAIYTRSLEGDVSPADRQLVGIAMDKIIARCDDFLVNGVQITNETRAKFRKLRHLCADESRAVQTNYDILSHWILIREALLDFDSQFGPKQKTI